MTKVCMWSAAGELSHRHMLMCRMTLKVLVDPVVLQVGSAVNLLLSCQRDDGVPRLVCGCTWRCGGGGAGGFGGNGTGVQG